MALGMVRRTRDSSCSEVEVIANATDILKPWFRACRPSELAAKRDVFVERRRAERGDVAQCSRAGRSIS